MVVCASIKNLSQLFLLPADNEMQGLLLISLNYFDKDGIPFA